MGWPIYLADVVSHARFERNIVIIISLLISQNKAVADPGFSKWGDALLSQMGGRTSCFQVKSA